MKLNNELLNKITNEGAKKALPSIFNLSTTLLLLIITYCVITSLLILSQGSPFMGQYFFTPDSLLMLITGILALIYACKLAFPDNNLKLHEKLIPFLPLSILLVYFINLTLSQNTNILVSCLKLNDFKCFFHMLKINLLPAVIGTFLLSRSFPTQHNWAGVHLILSISSFSYIILRLFEAPLNPLQMFIWHYIPVVLLLSIGIIIGNIIKRIGN